MDALLVVNRPYLGAAKVEKEKKEPESPKQILQTELCTTSFGATFAAVFVLNYWLREFPLSAFANRFELS